MDIAPDRSGSAERGIDFLPIDILGVGGRGDCRRRTNREKKSCSTHIWLLFNFEWVVGT
jgi:hypothetical protein